MITLNLPQSPLTVSHRRRILSLASELFELLDRSSGGDADIAPFAERAAALHRDLISSLPQDRQEASFNSACKVTADELDDLNMLFMATGSVVSSTGTNLLGERMTNPANDWRPILKGKTTEVRNQASSQIWLPNADIASLLASVESLKAELHARWKSGAVAGFSKSEADHMLGRAIRALEHSLPLVAA